MSIEDGDYVRTDCKLRSASRKWQDAVGRRPAQILPDLCRSVLNLDLCEPKLAAWNAPKKPCQNWGSEHAACSIPVQNLDLAGTGTNLQELGEELSNSATDWYLKIDLMPKRVQEMSAKKASQTY